MMNRNGTLPAALAAITAIAVLAPCSALASGIPVVDAAALSQALQTYLQLGRQYETLVSQYKEQVKSYEAMNGARSLGKLLWSPELRALLPQDFQASLEAVASGGAAALTPEARRLYDAQGLGNACAGLAPGRRSACEKEAAAAAQAQSFFSSAARTAAARSSSIEGLMAAINRAEDAKSIADLSARISAETAALTAERIRLESLSAIAAQNRRLLEISASGEAARRWAARADWKKHLE